MRIAKALTALFVTGSLTAVTVTPSGAGLLPTSVAVINAQTMHDTVQVRWGGWHGGWGHGGWGRGGWGFPGAFAGGLAVGLIGSAIASSAAYGYGGYYRPYGYGGFYGPYGYGGYPAYYPGYAFYNPYYAPYYAPYYRSFGPYYGSRAYWSYRYPARGYYARGWRW